MGRLQHLRYFITKQGVVECVCVYLVHMLIYVIYNLVVLLVELEMTAFISSSKRFYMQLKMVSANSWDFILTQSYRYS